MGGGVFLSMYHAKTLSILNCYVREPPTFAIFSVRGKQCTLCSRQDVLNSV